MALNAHLIKLSSANSTAGIIAIMMYEKVIIGPISKNQSELK